MSNTINAHRIRTVNDVPRENGTVAYWMDREMRMNDNWALLYAQSLALERRQPFAVVCCLPPKLSGATERAYTFMLKGLRVTEQLLREKQIPFFLLIGTPEIELPKFVMKYDVASLVTDFSPLENVERSKRKVSKKINSSMYIVDAHNIVPAWIASGKQEFGAYTIRPKIHRLLPEFLDEFPGVRKHPFPWSQPADPIDWDTVQKKLKVNRKVGEVNWILPGEKIGRRMLNDFLRHKLKGYGESRNNPVIDGQSNLSPYLHFGHISPQRVALETIRLAGNDIRTIVRKKVQGADDTRGDAESFLEELIVRRELADNFTFYNAQYASFEGFPAWAKQSLNEHRNDKREYLYSLSQFEQAETHDQLWNAAQIQMVKSGKMHGYMRMYWAKKILEWTPSPEEAMIIALYLNDKYELDGRDPNGYAGIAWSIGGVHDRAWFDRPVYGKVRYMNYRGCESKFNVREYIRQQGAL
ncbi:MAG: deoxyribodipyrimidine photo-lyase [Bacteroidota bacterium]